MKTAVGIVGMMLLSGHLALPVNAQQKAASTDLSPAIAERQNRQNALLQEANQLLKKKQWIAAEKLLREALALELDPQGSSPGFYESLAQSLEGQGRDREALVAMRQVFFGAWKGAETQPDLVARYALLAERVGEKAEARAAFQQAAKAAIGREEPLKLNAPANPTERQLLAIAWTAVGMAKNRHGETAASIASLQKALTYDSHCIIAHLELGELVTDRSFEEALAHFQEAAKAKHPDTRRFAEGRAEEVAGRIRARELRKKLIADGIIRPE